MKNIIGLVFVILLISCSKQEEEINTDIAYRNLEPNVVVTDSFLIDINTDGEMDVMFFVEKDFQGYSPTGESTYNYFSRCIAKNSNVSVSAGTRISTSQNKWNCLQYESYVSSQITWLQKLTFNGKIIGADDVGIWDINPSYDFIGVKIENGTKSYYGWVRLVTSFDTVSDNGYTITVGEYAYMISNNIVIRAGQIE